MNNLMIEVKDIPYSSLVESALTELRDPSNRERTAGELHSYLDTKYPGWWDRYTEEYEALKKRLLGEEPAAAATETQIGGTHYKDFAIQPAEFITRNRIGFLPGCVIKRMCRYQKKNGLEDLRKAIHEIELMIELEYGKESK